MALRLSCPETCRIFPDQRLNPCVGRWVLNHWATRKVPGVCPFTAGETGSNPGQGTKILHVSQQGHKIKINLKKKKNVHGLIPGVCECYFMWQKGLR